MRFTFPYLVTALTYLRVAAAAPASTYEVAPQSGPHDVVFLAQQFYMQHLNCTYAHTGTRNKVQKHHVSRCYLCCCLGSDAVCREPSLKSGAGQLENLCYKLPTASTLLNQSVGGLPQTECASIVVHRRKLSFTGRSVVHSFRHSTRCLAETKLPPAASECSSHAACSAAARWPDVQTTAHRVQSQYVSSHAKSMAASACSSQRKRCEHQSTRKAP